MKKIAIYSTQNLIQSSQIWKEYQGNYSLSFKDFGSWMGDFVEQSFDEDWILFILDFQDLFGDELLQNLEANNENLKESLEQIIFPIKELLKQKKKKVVLGKLSMSFHAFSSVQQARFQSIEQVITEYMEKFLTSAVRENTSVYYVDLDQLVLEDGVKQFYDNRNLYSARCRYSFNGLKKISRATYEIFERYFNARKKVLVLDCDNTLWGGVVGEVGLEGIQIGQDGMGTAFADFQRKIKRLKSKGIILAIASKNNFENVKEVFDKHSGMILKWDDFSSFKINWNEKSESLKEIAQELGLGIDSFVFWDDNPLERELVIKNLPMVEVADGSKPVYEWPKYLDSLTSFSQFVITNDDLNKSEQYKIGSLFQAEVQQASDKKSYLKLINLRPSVLDVQKDNIDRCVQLCQKTNQFNLRTIRYEKEEIERMLENPNYILKLFSLSDKFGDHGIIGLVIVSIDGSEAFLDTLLMSCRILGRYMESWIMEFIRLQLVQRNVSLLKGEWIKSDKNKMCENFFSEHGFEKNQDYLSELCVRYSYNCDLPFPNIEVFNG